MNQFSKLKIKRGDTVTLLRGRDRGKTGKVLAALPQVNKVMVEGLNLIHKHVRPRRGGEKGQRVNIAAPVWVGNVQLVCPSCKKATRVGVKLEGDERKRVCKKCDAAID